MRVHIAPKTVGGKEEFKPFVIKSSFGRHGALK
jgi:hypothetical protein